MARISLRDYNREIEELVDSGRTDEAIAHCRYILETYPKHVTTYRSLGKALLESQRYGDAADVFKRVLACIPDDFIAHLGMSIIREDEGDLDGSIWHMERAFEVQPSNAAVQSELRRLYGRRDGLTPAKVQLTRGAMARMSAKSHLYSQAIAELRTALADDPQRPDLQALLARMYTQTGQRLAAIETCNALLGKFPYCLEANRLMVEILPGTERAVEAETYRRRLEELDPYESHISPAAGTADQVQAGVITLERLDYLDIHAPIEAGAAQPEWASSLGVSIDQTPPSEEPIPDWLSAADESPAGPEGEISKEPPSDTEIPDWMRVAGWEPASAETNESVPGFEAFEEEQVGSGELAPAEIPDWLQGLAPETEPSPETPVESEKIDLGDEAAKAAILAAGLSESQSGIDNQIESEELPVEPEIPPVAEEGETKSAEVVGETGAILPEAEGAVILGASLAAGAALSAGKDESEETPIEEPAQPESIGEAPGEELPDWLAPSSAETGIQAESQPLPDWLVSEPGELQPAESETELPDWMMPAEAPVSGVEAAGLVAAAAGAAESLAKDEALPSEEPEPEVPSPQPMEGAPQGVAEWLAESAPEIPPESPIGEIEEEEQIEGVPEWLAKLSPEASTEASAAFVTDVVEQENDLEQADIPQWLREMEGSFSGEAIESTEVGTPEPIPMEIEDAGLEVGEIPDWLKAAMAAEAIDQIVESRPQEIEPVEMPIIEGDTKPLRIQPEQVETIREEPVEGMPEETGQAFEPEAIEEITVEQVEEAEPEQIPVGEVSEVTEVTPRPEETGVPGFESEDEAMAWLESLAARQGALEEELLTSPEERPSETPEWIQQFGEVPIEAGQISDQEEQAESDTEIARLAGLAAAGFVAKQQFEEESSEEPVTVVPQAAEWQPEEPSVETVQPEPVIEEGEITTVAAIVEELEPLEEAEAEEVELPEWLQGLETEAVTPSTGVVEGEWEPPAEFAGIETVVQPSVEAPRLDINTASLAQLERIPGVGFIIAQSIVAYREVNGPFTSLDQLQEIPGITPETSDELKHMLVIQEVIKTTPPTPTIPELEHAWQSIANGNISTAVDQYSYFIRQEQHLDEIINEIQEAVMIYPLDPLLYQTLGDAYLRLNRLQEAMEAYNHAEDLLK